MKATTTEAQPKNLTRLPAGVKVSARGICPVSGRAIHLRIISEAQHRANRTRPNFSQLSITEKMLANLSRTLDHEDLFANERTSAFGKNKGTKGVTF